MPGGIPAQPVEGREGGKAIQHVHCYMYSRTHVCTHQLLQCYMLALYEGYPYSPEMEPIPTNAMRQPGAPAW